MSSDQEERLKSVIARRDEQVAASARRDLLVATGSQTLFGVDEITPRETEVLALIADGLTNAQIGEQMMISVETVKSHVRHILCKLDVHTRSQAIAIAFRAGVLV